VFCFTPQTNWQHLRQNKKNRSFVVAPYSFAYSGGETRILGRNLIKAGWNAIDVVDTMR